MKKIILVLLGISAFFTFLPIILLFSIPMIVGGVLGDDAEEEINTSGFGFVMCNEEGEVDYGGKWDEGFAEAGTLSGSSDAIIELSKEYGLDPVLFSAIAMHETGWGTSTGVTDYNNPGGLMNPDTNWQSMIHFSSLRDGLESMAKTLNRMIHDEELVTIHQLGSKYAPLDAENDPNGLNVNWVPLVTEYANELGGLIMNCEVMGNVEIIGEKAWVVPHTKVITSSFRSASRPNHNGIDLAYPDINGSPVVALMDGEVIISELNGTSRVSDYNLWRNGITNGYGYYVAIDHGNGIETRYAHLIDQGVPAGTEVKKGETIGYVGSTGGSTGPHLHFEILVNGSFVDPVKHLPEFFEE